MDRIARYRKIIQEILANQAKEMEQQPVTGVDTELIIDETHDNYMLSPVGWSPQGRVHGATLYVRIRNGKFWIEEDWTEEGIASHLLAAGVPKEDIVLAFHAPEVRPHTEFAIS
ncbi:MAG: XisI protein [Caldilineaceae bacterium]